MTDPYEKQQGLLPQEDDVHTLTLSPRDTHTGAKLYRAGRRALQIWGALIGLCGGVTAAVLGSLLTATGWFTSNAGARQVLSTMGTVLLCLTIPLIVLAAYCLDWLERR